MSSPKAGAPATTAPAVIAAPPGPPEWVGPGTDAVSIDCPGLPDAHVQRGQTYSNSCEVKPLTNYRGTVTITCHFGPPGDCAVQPSTVDLASGRTARVTVTLTITPDSRSGLIPLVVNGHDTHNGFTDPPKPGLFAVLVPLTPGEAPPPVADYQVTCDTTHYEMKLNTYSPLVCHVTAGNFEGELTTVVTPYTPDVPQVYGLPVWISVGSHRTVDIEMTIGTNTIEADRTYTLQLQVSRRPGSQVPGVGTPPSWITNITAHVIP